jgi:hypothetical protein
MTLRHLRRLVPLITFIAVLAPVVVLGAEPISVMSFNTRFGVMGQPHHSHLHVGAAVDRDGSAVDFSVHLDHESQPSRERSTELLRRRIDARSFPGEPVIVILRRVA